MAHEVFISYSAHDRPVADAVCANLEQRGLRCWIAPRDVQPGRSFAGEITRAIQQSAAMVLVFSAHSNRSEQVLREVQLAVEGRLHIIQFRIEQVLLNDDLKYYLSTPHWLDALTVPLQDHLVRLADAITSLIRTDTSGRSRDVGVSPAALESPVAPTNRARSFSRRLSMPTIIVAMVFLASIALYRVMSQWRGSDSISTPSTAVTSPRLSEVPIPLAAPQASAVPNTTKDELWENTLGMRFLKVPGIDASFSIWDTRVQDYTTFVRSTGYISEDPPFPQGPTHPVTNVSWEEAHAFCVWLTDKERHEGKLETGQEYRLPTDSEWSIAVNLNEESGGTPMDKNGKVKDVYPWGSEWPPPRGAGNYAASLNVDHFTFTSPVGSFPANRLGLYDLGGNVWQWCEDWTDDLHNARVLRGSTWVNNQPEFLLSAARIVGLPKTRYAGVSGFRCVLAQQNPTIVAMPARDTLMPQGVSTWGGASKLVRVTNTKHHFSALLPSAVFTALPATIGEDSSTFFSPDRISLVKLFVQRLGDSKAFDQFYRDSSAEHTNTEPKKTVDYKLLKKDWFVVSGENNDRGYYLKAVKRGAWAFCMYFECDSQNYPIDEQTLTLMSRGFKGD